MKNSKTKISLPRGLAKNKRAYITLLLAFTGILFLLAGLYTYINEDRVPPLTIEDAKDATSGGKGPLALIYDPLYREYPNDEIINTLVSLLEDAGYRVNVYRGVNATLDPLQFLDSYDLVIIRAHGGYSNESRGQYPRGSYIYTGLHLVEAYEKYGASIDSWINKGLLTKGVIIPPELQLQGPISLPRYLVVTPKFFEERVKLKEGSIVIYYGCYGLDDEVLAGIFLSKGAKAYVSWKGGVTVNYMDKTLPGLVNSYINNGIEGIQSFIESQPPDPLTNATLVLVKR